MERSVRKCPVKIRRLIIAAVIAAALILVAMPAFAWTWTFFQDLAETWLEDILGGATENTVLEYFKTPIYESDRFSDAWALVKVVIKNVVGPIAVSIIGLTFVIKIIEMTMEVQQVTPERLVTPFIMLMVALFFVSESFHFTEAILKIGSILANRINTYVLICLGAESADVVEMFIPDWNNLTEYVSSVIQSALLCLELLLPHLVWWICDLLAKVICWGILLEIVIRCMLLPFFAGDFMINGFHGRGMQQLKALVACACTGALIIAISGIQTALSISILNDEYAAAQASGILQTVEAATGAAGLIIIIQFACLSMMMKASQLARETFGA